MQRAVERHNRRLERRPARDARRRERGRRRLRGRRLVRHAGGRGVAPVRAANGGQILVSDLVRALAGTRTRSSSTSLGPRELKGLAEPLVVCEASGSAARRRRRCRSPRSSTSRPRSRSRAAPPSSSACVDLWKETPKARARVVLVSGEPGIGKTRLVTELSPRARRGRHRAVGALRRGARHPLRAVRRSAAPVRRRRRPERLRAEIGPLGGELTRIVPDLAARVPGLAEPLPG